MAYVGSELSFLDCEKARLSNIANSISRLEPELFETKWWDYRQLHPSKATYLFAEHYRQAVKLSVKRRRDVNESMMVYGMNRKDFMELSKKDRTGMWIARQTADSFGIPYDFWCFSAILYAEKNLWTFIPSPNQLYSSEVNPEHEHFKVSMVDFILNRWADRNDGLILCAESDFYKRHNYTGDPHQKDHLRFVFRQLKRSRNKGMVAAELIYKRGVITKKDVKALLGNGADSVLEEVERIRLICEEIL